MSSRSVVQVQKYAAEIVDYSIDFTDVLEAGESVSSGTASISSGDGVLVISDITTVDPTIAFRLSVGTVGTFYHVDIAATLDTGEVIVQRMSCEVR